MSWHCCCDHCRRCSSSIGEVKLSSIYILDTSVILHNWNVLREKRTMVIPQQVLDELEKFQDESGDLGDNARSASWWLSQQLNSCHGNEICSDGSRIIFWQENEEKTHDQKILYVANQVKSDKFHFNDDVIVLTKSVALRAKARNNGISAEDYDDVGFIEEIDGWRKMPITVDEMEKILQDRDMGMFHLDGRENLAPNEYVECTCEGKTCSGMIYRHVGNGDFSRVDLKPHMASIVPKNPEQVMLANSLLDRDMHLVTAIGSAGSGKALVNGSPVLTEKGYVKIETLCVGDKVFGTDGKLHNVVGVFPQGKKRVYEVHFTDGTTVKCNDEHLWTYQTRQMRNAGKRRNKEYWKTATLRELIDTVPIIIDKEEIGKGKFKGIERNIYLPIAKSLQFEERELTIPPYTMGAMIGDGCMTQGISTFSSEDVDVLEKINGELANLNCCLRQISKYDYRIVKLDDGLSKYNLFDNIAEHLGMRGKHSWEKSIPEDYLFNTIENRLELLKGLIDTDGSIEHGGMYHFHTTSEKLKDQVKFLAESLGCVVSWKERITHYEYNGEKKEGRKSYALNIKYGEIEKLHFSEKREKQWSPCRWKARRTIENIIETDEYEEMTCISIDSDDHLFLTDSCIPTHNTILAIAAGIQQVLMKPKEYSRIIITRPIMPVGRDLGFLPGDVNEKMGEWIRPFMNNIEFIKEVNQKAGKNRVAEDKIGMLLDLNSCRDVMEVLPLTYIRGCSISNAFIIVDEAQNATPSEMKTIITRVGEGSKLVLLGDINQIDNRFLSKECNGLTMAIKKFWGNGIYSHVTLKTVERSRLAELATKILF